MDKAKDDQEPLRMRKMQKSRRRLLRRRTSDGEEQGKREMIPNMVESPPHYAELPIQPKDFIIKNKLGYAEGNVIKYMCRWRSKGGAEDLKKARQYIDYLLEEVGEDGGK